jgi:hypothetical protein
MPYKDLEKRTAWKREWVKKNKEKVREYSKNYQSKKNIAKQPRIKKTAEELKEVHSKARKARIQRNRDYINSIKQENPCKNCGETHIACLAFHHRDKNEKEYSISNMENMSLETIKKEIAKCDMLCHNCHAKHHYNEGMPSLKIRE